MNNALTVQKFLDMCNGIDIDPNNDAKKSLIQFYLRLVKYKADNFSNMSKEDHSAYFKGVKEIAYMLANDKTKPQEDMEINENSNFIQPEGETPQPANNLQQPFKKPRYQKKK